MGLSVTVNQKHGPIFFSSYLVIDPPILNQKNKKIILKRNEKESGTKRNHQRLKYK